MAQEDKGLKAAATRILGATAQRCRVHFMRNLLAHAGRQGRRVVSAFVATAFAQDDADSAAAQWRLVADQLKPKAPKLAALSMLSARRSTRSSSLRCSASLSASAGASRGGPSSTDSPAETA